MRKSLSSARFSANMGTLQSPAKKKAQIEEGEIPREEWNEVSRKKGNKASTSQANTPAKRKKAIKNNFHILATEA